MICSIKEKILFFFNKGQERTILTKKNIAASFVIKGITILISVILVPLTINYVNPERNGIWVTLYSMIIWLNLFDIGFGLGMKNKLAEAKAKGEEMLAKKYISSTYVIMGLICVGIFLFFCFVNPFLDWIKILKNVPLSYADEIEGFVWISILAFCATFVLNIIKVVVTADQRPAIGSFIDMLGQALTLVGIFILSKTCPPSLITLGLVTGFAPVVVYAIASLVLFGGKYKKWKPAFRFVDFKLAGKTMNLGFQFFVTTCASFMITQTLPFLIQRMTNPVEVTNFNTAFRLFAVAFNVMSIIIIPYWSSFTDAYSQKDSAWMKKSILVLYKSFGGFMLVQLLLLAFSGIIYYVWVNYWMQDANILDITPFLSSSVCIYICVLCWVTINIYPLNGIGKMKLQVYSAIVEMCLLLPVAWIMGNMLGVQGIVLAPVVIYIPRIIWSPIQLRKLINNKATGIWNK